MKKTTILIITIISLIVFLIGSFLFVKKARENRTWPFNSTLSNYFPKSIKNFGYKITNPDKIILRLTFTISRQNIMQYPAQTQLAMVVD